MWSYRVGNPLRSLAWAVFFLVMTILALGSILEAGSVGEIFFPSLFGASALAFEVSCLRTVHEVRIDPDGVVIFVRLLGRTPLHVSNIQRLEGRSENEYGKRKWYLDVHYRVRRERRIVLDEFPEARAFAARIGRLNPSVRFLGEWPVGPP